MEGIDDNVPHTVHTTIALTAGLNPASAALLEMLADIGGGVLRDILVEEVRGW